MDSAGSDAVAAPGESTDDGAVRLPIELRRDRTVVLVTVAACVVAVDQLTKWWAVNALDDRTIDLVWTFRLRLVFNTGAAQKYVEALPADLPVIRSPADWSAID